MPEPWATRLVQEGGGKVLLDEKTLWPEGKYVTTHLIVRTDYLEAHPDIIRALLAGHVAANDLVNSDPAKAQELTNQGIEKITGKTIAENVITSAWPNLTFTVDPIASSLAGSAEHATKVGLLDPVDLTGIYDLDLLNELAHACGQANGERPVRALVADADRHVSPSSETAPAIRLEAVSKVFGRGADAVVALDGLDLTVEVGSFVCLVGASGCGKSTLLNIVAGLDAPTSGTVQIDGSRPTLIFQEAALFPWLTAAENVELALRLRGVPKRQRRGAVADLLELVHLSGFAAKRPHELSGGMRQRVALARALAQEARILLLDEPFGALDAITRDLLHEELERIWRDAGLTILFVTHNVREAVRLGQRVVLLSSRPGRAVAEFPVVIAGERRIELPEVSALAITIGEQLSEQVRRHATR